MEKYRLQYLALDSSTGQADFQLHRNSILLWADMVGYGRIAPNPTPGYSWYLLKNGVKLDQKWYDFMQANISEKFSFYPFMLENVDCSILELPAGSYTIVTNYNRYGANLTYLEKIN